MVVSYYSDEIDDSEDLYYYNDIMRKAGFYSEIKYKRKEIAEIKTQYKKLKSIIREYIKRIDYIENEFDVIDDDYKNQLKRDIIEYIQKLQDDFNRQIFIVIEKRIDEIDDKTDEIFKSFCYQFNMDDRDIREYREKLGF